MSDEIKFTKDLFAGLQTLAASAFPKECASCGRVYTSAEEFLTETQALNEKKSGLKESLDDDEAPIIEVFRNCVCGSTLLEFFSNRRDTSEQGLRRREKFGELLEYLINKEKMDPKIAKAELLKVVKGEGSEILKKIKLPEKKV